MFKNLKLSALYGVIVLFAAAGLYLLIARRSESPMFRPVDELKVRMTMSLNVPDPANIQSTGDWYYLDHVSSGLVFYDADQKKFAPLLAESWSTEANGTHKFKLRKGLKFNDGSSITAKDVIWSIKRQLIKKSATHFPLWEYVVGCENLKKLTDECDGIRAQSEYEIEIRLKTQNESFFLQLASPETSIWAADDMDSASLELKPTKFSGAYYFSSQDETSTILKRNEKSLLSEKFPDSPRRIRLFTIPAAKLNQALVDKTIDLTIRPYVPMGEPDWSKERIAVRSTTASNIFYLFGLGDGKRPAIGRDLVEAIWALNGDKKISPAETFLPFSKKFGLTRDEFLSNLPEHSASKIRIFCPDRFFSDGFIQQLKDAAKSVGVEFVFSFAPALEWFNAFEDLEAQKKYDYMLSLYAASERYPAVQLRYLTNKFAKTTIDLKPAEAPDIDLNRAEILRDYQKWLLGSFYAVPLFFGNTLFLHQENLDLGQQSESDAEIELWRVREKLR